MSRKNVMCAIVAGVLMSVWPSPCVAQTDPVADKLIANLNQLPTVKTTKEQKSYTILFDAYLALSKPPFPIDESFNLNTIHPKMDEWSAVSGWSESNAKMAQAVIAARSKIVFGLPYGEKDLEARYVQAGLTALVGVDGNLRNIQFNYIPAIDTIAAFVTAEVYRLMEANQVQEAGELMRSHIFVLRQLCDREFLDEKLHMIDLMSDVMGTLRDVFYTYQDRITAEQYSSIAINDLPFLRPDRSALLMPEADRLVAQALIESVFDARGQPDADKFTSTFAEIQSADEPLTRFGAARRWRMIAAVHGALKASNERLGLIYDDWWRRWRVQEYDEILDIDTQFERANPVRYAAVIYSMRDVETIFSVRNQLVVEINGTTVAAGLCAYKKTLGTYPANSEMIYTQFIRKRSDSDPYDLIIGPFQYMLVNDRKAIDTPEGRVWIEPDEKECLLFSVGQDHEDNRGASHSDDGAEGDIVIWPPMKAYLRKKQTG